MKKKASQFNLFFPYDSHQIGYNSFSDEYIILEEMLYDMYDASKKTGDFDELKQVHQEFFDTLCGKGFLVDNGFDEVEAVKEISRKIDNDDTKFELHINPTMNCNFKCWYCYETHIKDSKMDEQTVNNTKSFIAGIFNQQTNLKEFTLGWFGGEPLLYFERVIVPLLEFSYNLARDRGVIFHSSITTNGLLVNSKVIQHALGYGLSFFQITLDGARERHDKVRFISEGRGSYDAIVSNIITLAQNKITVSIRINISLETLPGIRQIPGDFLHLDPETKKFLVFDLHKVWQVGEDIDDEINDERNYFREMGFNVSSGTMNTVLNSCYGDHRYHATLNYNGEAFKCTARDFTTLNSEGLLTGNGSIIWNEKYEKRLSSKFKNKPCLECTILPMCGGGCSQQAIEHEGRDYCVNDFDENKKLQLVKNRFFEILAEHG